MAPRRLRGGLTVSDRYTSLARTAAGRFLVKRLGLPDPVPLARFSPGGPLLVEPVLVGGEGRCRGAAIASLAAAGGEVFTAAPRDGLFGALLYDASALSSASELVGIQQFLTPVIRRLHSCGRVVVLATTPDAAGTVSARIAQRALEGFTRSLAKEVGRGSTVQLVYVMPGAEAAIASTLRFLLSAKSAYVSGQVIRVDTPVGPNGAADLDAPLAGKLAVVTGASRGIGAAIARTLHRDGARIVGVDVPQAADAMQRMADEVDGERVSLDITSVDAPQRLARRLADTDGGVDIVVHNAGITRDRRLANMTSERWIQVIDVNVTAQARITSELLAQDLIRPGGRVVCVSSIAGIAGNPGQTNYATSKAAVIGLVEAYAGSTRDQGITVNAVAPGFIETSMTATVPLLIKEAGRRMNSMRQGGLPVDVAETVAWLAAPDSGGVTANTVRVCGQSLLGA
jgi:3-oxoacyl-[acyl-carrier protein] reductase